MRKNIQILAALLLATVIGFMAEASTYQCPNPDQIRCVPAVNNIGRWVHNGGQMTGNSFAPNNECANVIALGAGHQRLLCCYEKCGVFIQDVRSRQCTKLNESTFDCR